MTNSRSALAALALVAIGAVAVTCVAAPAFAGLHLLPGKSKKDAKAGRATPVATADDWRQLDPENVLVIDTTKGRIFVELSPQSAPLYVERMKLLTRQRFFATD